MRYGSAASVTVTEMAIASFRAGHSVAGLLRVYAKCIAGQEEAARHRAALALGLHHKRTRPDHAFATTPGHGRPTPCVSAPEAL
ncbi:hypothetical protein GCM10010464_35710 [Pseudonocardia yunnanensis]